MQTTYFKGVELTEAAIKKLYRDLCKMHHPDIGGSEASMKAINADYWDMLKSIDGKEQPKLKSWHKTGPVYTFNEQAEQALINKIRQVQNLRLSAQCEVIIDRCWLWIRGFNEVDAIRLNESTGIGFRRMACKPWYDGRISDSFYWHDFTQKYIKKGRKVYRMGSGVQSVGKRADDSGKYLN